MSLEEKLIKSKYLLDSDKFFLQFGKFVVVGFMNTTIDFMILNILMYITNIYKGLEIIIFNMISFTFAVTNSYILNKYWTFKDGTKRATGQFVGFVAVSIVGMIINTATVYGMTTLIGPMFGLGIKLWANFAKTIATLVVLSWNFIGYKFLIFKDNKKCQKKN